MLFACLQEHRKGTNVEEKDLFYMQMALKEAEKALKIGEVPIGTVIVWDDGRVVGTGYNTRETKKCALHHAEIKAIEEACRTLGGWRLHKATLYVTCEPCPMCAGAIMNARVRRVVYGCKDPKAGAYGSIFSLNDFPVNHKPEVVCGVCERESADLLKTFFETLREPNNK